MLIPADTIRNISVVFCKIVEEKNLPPHRARARTAKGPKVEVEMETIDDRDLIMSYAVNLNGSSNIEIVVPDKLRVLQVRLEHFAFKYRRASKERAAGNKDREARTQIRLDNQLESLVLGIRDEKEGAWEFFSESRLPKLDGTRLVEVDDE